MDVHAIAKLLEGLPGPGLSEVAHVTEFRAYRQSKTHGMQEVTIRIYDAGPGTPHRLRYSCVAETENGQMATGNPDGDLNTVLATVHWGDLDREPDR